MHQDFSTFLPQKSLNLGLIEKKDNGLTLTAAKEIYNRNKRRYRNFLLKLNQPREKIGTAMFNAFLLDCERQQRKTCVAPYASFGEK